MHRTERVVIQDPLSQEINEMDLSLLVEPRRGFDLFPRIGRTYEILDGGCPFYKLKAVTPLVILCKTTLRM